MKEKMNTHHELLYAMQCFVFFFLNFVYAFSYIHPWCRLLCIASHRITSTPSNIGLSTSTLLNRIPLTLKSLFLFPSDSFSLSLSIVFVHASQLATLIAFTISFEDSVRFFFSVLCLFIFNFRTWILFFFSSLRPCVVVVVFFALSPSLYLLRLIRVLNHWNHWTLHKSKQMVAYSMIKCQKKWQNVWLKSSNLTFHHWQIMLKFVTVHCSGVQTIVNMAAMAATAATEVAKISKRDEWREKDKTRCDIHKEKRWAKHNLITIKNHKSDIDSFKMPLENLSNI